MIGYLPHRRLEGHSPRHRFGRPLRLLRHFRPGPSGQSCHSNLEYERRLTPLPHSRNSWSDTRSRWPDSLSSRLRPRCWRDTSRSSKLLSADDDYSRAGARKRRVRSGGRLCSSGLNSVLVDPRGRKKRYTKWTFLLFSQLRSGAQIESMHRVQKLQYDSLRKAIQLQTRRPLREATSVSNSPLRRGSDSTDFVGSPGGATNSASTTVTVESRAADVAASSRVTVRAVETSCISGSPARSVPKPATGGISSSAWTEYPRCRPWRNLGPLCGGSTPAPVPHGPIGSLSRRRIRFGTTSVA